MSCFANLSFVWLVGRSGHCTVSGPSGDGVSAAPSGLGDPAACWSSVRGCSSIQLANTSMVWESKSPATSGGDHRETNCQSSKVNDGSGGGVFLNRHSKKTSPQYKSQGQRTNLFKEIVCGESWGKTWDIGLKFGQKQIVPN